MSHYNFETSGRFSFATLPISGLSHMAGRRSNLCVRIDELARPTKSSPLRSILASVATIALVITGLTDAAHTQERDPDITKHKATAVQAEAANLRSAAPNTQGTSLENRIARIRGTPNWRFVNKQFLETIEKRQGELHGVAVTVLGVAYNEQNQPIEGALALLRLVSNISRSRLFNKQAQDVFAVTWSDDKGVFKFQNQPAPWFEPASPLAWELCVFAPGYAIETRSYAYLDGEPRNERIVLQPERSIEGRVKAPDGTPITDIEFAHVEIVDPYDNADIEYSLLGSEILTFIEPDIQGRFRIGGLPPQRIASVFPRRVSASNVMRAISIATSGDLEPKKMIAKDRPRAGMVYPYFDPVFEIVFDRSADLPATKNPRSSSTSVKPRPTRTVTVQVVNAKDREGVSGMAVGWDRNVDELRISPGMQTTNNEGTTKLEVPQDAVDVFIGGRRYGFVTPYNRITTSTEEYAPTVERSYWVRRVSPGEEDISLTFELQPVPPLKITVQREDGTPVLAELLISRQGWEGCHMPRLRSDDQGRASVAIRPVMFDVEITATTKDGLKGSLPVKLSNDISESETVRVIVR